MDRFARSRLLIGQQGLNTLAQSHVLVLGLGGVGSYAAESLARSGLGRLTLVDGDLVSVSNLNRQLIALTTTLGQKKVDVMARRLQEINEEGQFRPLFRHLTEEDIAPLLAEDYAFVVDALDDLPVKASLAVVAATRNLPLISCLGTANKLDPTRLRISDLQDTHTDPLARKLRRRLADGAGNRLTVVWSDEKPRKAAAAPGGGLGTMPFVPPAAGILMAHHVVFSLLQGQAGAEKEG